MSKVIAPLDHLLFDTDPAAAESSPSGQATVPAEPVSAYARYFPQPPVNTYLEEPEALEIPEFLRRQADEIMGVVPAKTGSKTTGVAASLIPAVAKTVRHVSTMIGSIGKPDPQPTVPAWRIRSVMDPKGQAETLAAAAQNDTDLEIPAFLKRGGKAAHDPE